MHNYTFPNEPLGEILWGVIIVLYPFMTCMVDGCALVASIPVLFRNEKLKPVARLALLLSLSFIPIAFLPLLCDIGQPTRAFHIMMTPRLVSPMAIFGFIFSVVVALVALETWLNVRPDLVARWEKSRGPLRWLYAILSLGVRPVTPRSRAIDHKVIVVLEILALPAAIILTGYVGFIFGTVPANPWWSSPLRPLIFLAGAAVAGLSMVMVAGIALRPRLIPDETIRSLSKGLVACLVAVAALCALEVISILYPGGTAQQVLDMIFGPGGPVRGTFFYGQLLLGVAVPLAILVVALAANFRGALLKASAFASGLLGIAGTFLLLWNVVIGGQLASKSLRGIVDYQPHLGGRKGVIAVLVIACLPIVLFAIYNFLVPAFARDEDETAAAPAKSAESA